MMRRCDEIDELIAAYALDALDSEQRLEVIEHLSECRNHDLELVAYREVASLLPLAVEDAAPGAAARPRLLREFAVAVGGGGPVAELRPRRRLASLVRGPAFAYGLAAALFFGVLGLAAWNLSLREDERPAVLTRSVQQGNLVLRLVYLREERLAVLDLDLPPLAPDRAYQAWQITSSGPVSLGLVRNRGTTAVQADLSGASAVAISVEPATGSPAPTTTPLLVAEF